MRQCLILLLPVNPDGPLIWGEWRDDRITDMEELSLKDAGQLADKRLPVALVIPGQNVQTFEHDLPKMNRRERLKAVLFSIEDKLSMPLEGLHAALQEGELQTVSVIDKQLMQEAHDWAASVGLSVQSMIADYDALREENAQALSLKDRVIVSSVLGHTLDPAWYDGPLETIDTQSVLSRLGTRLTNSTNLMQGAFAPKTKFGGAKKTWFQLAGLAATLGFAVLFFEAMQAKATQAQADDIRAQTAQLYAQKTGQPAPSNPARAIAQATRQDKVTPTQFLTLSDIAFQALSEFEDVTIERMSFQDSRNELQLRLVYPSFERADAVQQAMQSAGGLFIPGGVREQSGRFVGEAVLKLGGPS